MKALSHTLRCCQTDNIVPGWAQIGRLTHSEQMMHIQTLQRYGSLATLDNLSTKTPSAPRSVISGNLVIERSHLANLPASRCASFALQQMAPLKTFEGARWTKHAEHGQRGGLTLNTFDETHCREQPHILDRAGGPSKLTRLPLR